MQNLEKFAFRNFNLEVKIRDKFSTLEYFDTDKNSFVSTELNASQMSSSPLDSVEQEPVEEKPIYSNELVENVKNTSSLEELQKSKDAIYQEGYNQGFSQGYNKGKEEGIDQTKLDLKNRQDEKTKYIALEQVMKTTLDKFSYDKASAFEEVQLLINDILLLILEKVVVNKIDVKFLMEKHIIPEIYKLQQKNIHLCLHVHKDDLNIFKEIADSHNIINLELIAEENIKINECYLSAEDAKISYNTKEIVDIISEVIENNIKH